MRPKAHAPSRARQPVSSTTGNIPRAQESARVTSTAHTGHCPRKTSGAMRADSTSDALKTMVGHGRVMTAGDTAAANKSAETNSQLRAMSSETASREGGAKAPMKNGERSLVDRFMGWAAPPEQAASPPAPRAAGPLYPKRRLRSRGQS